VKRSARTWFPRWQSSRACKWLPPPKPWPKALLHFMSTDHWQLAVIDLFLGGGTGLSVLRAYRDRLPHQRMVVLTNYATPEVRRRCLELGADGVFDKSTELEAFFELCNSYRV